MRVKFTCPHDPNLAWHYHLPEADGLVPRVGEHVLLPTFNSDGSIGALARYRVLHVIHSIATRMKHKDDWKPEIGDKPNALYSGTYILVEFEPDPEDLLHMRAVNENPT
jgi:hypothetical protein